MTAAVEVPTGEIPSAISPPPRWAHSARNIVNISYRSHGKHKATNYTGRIVGVVGNVMTLLHPERGTPLEVNLDRIRQIVVMVEGNNGARLRVIAIRCIVQAARALANPKRVGGDLQRAADLIALAMELFPELRKGNPAPILEELRESGVDI